MGESPKQTEDDTVKCKVNQCFRMKYWTETSADGKKKDKKYPGYFGGCREDLPGQGGPWAFPNDCKDYTVSRDFLGAFLGGHGKKADGQRWKLDNKKLENKEGVWTSDDLWIFKTKDDDLIYVENTSKTKVLGATSDGKVILEDFEDGKAHQLWRKGELDAENYFTLENSGVPKVLTAISESSLEINDQADESEEQNKLNKEYFDEWIEEIKATKDENCTENDNIKFKYDYKVEMCYCKNEKDEKTPCNGKTETIGVSKSGVATLALTIVLLAISIIGVWFFVKSCQVNKGD